MSEHGLRMLSQQLVDDRIDEVHRHGCLTAMQRQQLRARNVYAIANQIGREHQVCLILRRTIFDEQHNGCEGLLGAWGGEAVNDGPLDPTRDLVIGRPAIVAARVDLTVSSRVSPTFPALGKLFVATLLDMGSRSADVRLRSPVAPEDILDIWQPGHPEYDRHQHVPR